MVNNYLVAKASEENPANITECTAPNNFTQRIVKFSLKSSFIYHQDFQGQLHRTVAGLFKMVRLI